MALCFDYDTGHYYDTRQLTRRSPFQSHVRLNIEKMIFSGCLSKQDVQQYKDVDITEPAVDIDEELQYNLYYGTDIFNSWNGNSNSDTDMDE